MSTFTQQGEEWVEKHLQQIVGGTITNLVKDVPSEEEQEYGCETFWGFQVRTPQGKTLICIIQSDTEGNGSGFLNIMEE